MGGRLAFIAAVGAVLSGSSALAQPVRRVGAAALDDARGGGTLVGFEAASPWGIVTPELAIPPQCTIRYAFGRLYVMSPLTDVGVIYAVDPATWVVVDTYVTGFSPMDIAVVHPRTAYVTTREGTHLLRIDLASGELTPAVDLSPFADADGVPEMATMAMHGRRLFVALQRIDMIGGMNAPPLLVVVDVDGGELVDVDPGEPGVQGIALAGTYPRGKMSVVSATRRLYVNAAGAFFDAGGIEMIDLEGLASLGLVIAEADGETGADLNSFTMTRAEAGFLNFSTDFAASSHLKRFTLAGGVEPGGELYGALNYLAPVLLHDPRTDHVHMPVGGAIDSGVHVFDAADGTRLTAAAVPTGAPSDLALYYAGCGVPGDANGDGLAAGDDVQAIVACVPGGRPECDCFDFDGSGALDETDAVMLARLLFVP